MYLFDLRSFARIGRRRVLRTLSLQHHDHANNSQNKRKYPEEFHDLLLVLCLPAKVNGFALQGLYSVYTYMISGGRKGRVRLVEDF